MTEQSSTVEDLTTTTVGVIQQTANRSHMTSTGGADFYFQCAVVVIGVVGTAANAVIVRALVASGQHKKHLLIVNQNALDLVSCVFLVISYSVKLCNIRLTGNSGHWLCATILSEAFVWWGQLGSRIGLAIITIDRYLKVVHPVRTKKWLRGRVIHSAMAFSWIGALIYSFAVNFNTTAVIDGVCYAAVIWKSQEVMAAHGIWNFMSFYVIILVIIIFCYGRILIAIRHQAKVMAGHAGSVGSSTAQAQICHFQKSVIKTMLLVSVFYAVANFPVDFYFLLANVKASVTLNEGGYYATVFIMFFYSCINPVIYATQFHPVKNTLLTWISRRKNSVAAASQIPNI